MVTIDWEKVYGGGDQEFAHVVATSHCLKCMSRVAKPPSHKDSADGCVYLFT